MKKQLYTRAEKLLFAAPLLIVALIGAGHLWPRPTPKLPVMMAIPPASAPRELVFSPNGKQLAVLWTDFRANGFFRGIRVFDVKTRAKICDLETPPPMSPNPNFIGGAPRYVRPSWSPDGSNIVAGYWDDTKGNTKIPTGATQKNTGAKFRFNHIAKFAIWNARNGNLIGNYYYSPINEASMSGPMRFSPDGNTLIGRGQPPARFDALTGQRLSLLNPDTINTSARKINVKAGLVAQVNQDQTHFRVFDAKTSKTVWEPKIIHAYDFEWRGDVLGALAGDFKKDNDSRLLLWNAKTRQPMSTSWLPKTGVVWFAFSPDKQMIAVGINKNNLGLNRSEVLVWNYRLNRGAWRSPKLPALGTMQWSPDGKWLVATNRTLSHLFIFDHSGHLRFEQECAGFFMAWSPDSTQLAYSPKSADSIPRIEVLNVADFKQNITR